MKNTSLLTICLTAAGRRAHLIETLRADARALGFEPKILALDSAPALSAGCQLADVVETAPGCSSPGYIRSVLAACGRHDAKVLIPTIDLDLQLLADARELFLEQGTTPVVSAPAAVRIARDKLRTISTLASAGLPVPATQTLLAALRSPGGTRFPAILKPVDGSNSRGLHFISCWDDIPKSLPDLDVMLIQERCLGPEYTINAYVDQNGELRCAVPHRRLEIRGGEVSKARTERRQDLQDLAQALVSAVPGLRGPFCFQAILTDEGPKVFEINARFGGGYPLAHAAGATFGRWLLEEAMGLPCSANDVWQDGLLMLRYDAAVFVKQ